MTNRELRLRQRIDRLLDQLEQRDTQIAELERLLAQSRQRTRRWWERDYMHRRQATFWRNHARAKQ